MFANALQHIKLQSWLGGFLSGYNIGSGGVDFLAQPSFDALTAWMDNYCRSHPLNGVAEAAVDLTKELRSRAERKSERK
ncbi:hypothetical protein [Bradyrhizobium australiense]|uniref:Uncharacterized protein n=1 Tax=Bradyrhizobium australiense TaxID=2721161 RepID=A0A7Y4LYR4_9BRAD|nr:hypothetical protein [Bradyrhizobium australiense]NOJ43035.1 hypothetical protein [Bradyrhizobium australiense]